MHKGSSFSTSWPTLVIFCFSGFCLFLTLTILIRVRRHLIVVLICISLMISDAEHLSMCLLAICVSALEKCSFKSFSNFWIGLLGFGCWVLGVLYRFWIWIPYQFCDLQILFSRSVVCLITLWIVSFEAQNVFIFMKSSLFISFLLLPMSLVSDPRNHCLALFWRCSWQDWLQGWVGVEEPERGQGFLLPLRLLAQA